MATTNVNTEAKEAFITKIINLFPNDFITCVDKKYYFWSNGVQVCVTLTCPKTPVGESSTPPSAFPPVTQEELKYDTVEFTQDEKDKINKLMASLGI